MYQNEKADVSASSSRPFMTLRAGTTHITSARARSKETFGVNNYIHDHDHDHPLLDIISLSVACSSIGSPALLPRVPRSTSGMTKASRSTKKDEHTKFTPKLNHLTKKGSLGTWPETFCLAWTVVSRSTQRAPHGALGTTRGPAPHPSRITPLSTDEHPNRRSALDKNAKSSSSNSSAPLFRLRYVEDCPTPNASNTSSTEDTRRVH